MGSDPGMDTEEGPAVSFASPEEDGPLLVARVGLHHRALAVEIPDGLLWFWIGDRNRYDRFVG